MGKRKYRKYTVELLSNAVNNSISYAGVLRYLGIKFAGGSQTHIKNKIKQFDIDISHFTHQGWNKGGVSNNRKSANEILIFDESKGIYDYRAKVSQLKRALIEVGVRYGCKRCEVESTWCDEKLVLHVDHIDGNYHNNLKENLRFLCPNCHSQTPNYCRSKKQ